MLSTSHKLWNCLMQLIMYYLMFKLFAMLLPKADHTHISFFKKTYNSF